MAEAWARQLKGEVIDAYLAGTHPKTLDPLAVQVMAETAKTSGAGCCAPSRCSSQSLDVTTLAASIGYTVEELRDLPSGANMSLSCGNPTAIASLQPGLIVSRKVSGIGGRERVAGEDH
jgi:hypothetical protein